MVSNDYAAAAAAAVDGDGDEKNDAEEWEEVLYPSDDDQPASFDTRSLCLPSQTDLGWPVLKRQVGLLANRNSQLDNQPVELLRSQLSLMTMS